MDLIGNDVLTHRPQKRSKSSNRPIVECFDCVSVFGWVSRGKKGAVVPEVVFTVVENTGTAYRQFPHGSSKQPAYAERHSIQNGVKISCCKYPIIYLCIFILDNGDFYGKFVVLFFSDIDDVTSDILHLDIW